MLNEVKVNILRDDCDCDYVLSEASLIFGEGTEPFIRIFMYVGEGLENPQCRMWANGDGSETWLAYRRYYSDGILAVLAQKKDFDKVTEKGLVCEAINNGELIGKRNVLFFPHDLSNTKEWQVTRYDTSAKTYVFDVTGIGTSSGGSGGGGGGTTYTAGAGIDKSKSSESSEISAKIDSKTIQFDADGKMYVPTVPLTLENAIVIQEADAKYLLHEYTQVEYIAGNRIGYAGAQNQIIAQGLITYNKSTMTTGVMAAIPNYQYYTDVSFEKPVFLAYGSYIYDINRIYYRHKASYNTYDQYELVFVKTDGTEVIYGTINAYRTYSEPVCKFAFGWENIYPPGYSPTENQFCEYGCAYAIPMLLVSSNSDASKPYMLSQIGNSIYIPYIQFATEAEYNAAVGLTYEPQTLTQVNETVTEV